VSAHGAEPVNPSATLDRRKNAGLTLVSAPARARPQRRALAAKARTVPERGPVASAPPAARHLLERALQCAVPARKEHSRAAGILADVKVDGRAELVLRRRLRLPAPRLVAGSRAKVRHLHNDRLERPGVGRRVRVKGRRQREASPTRIARAKSVCGAEGQLADRGGIT
jgi:hypothetical protein